MREIILDHIFAKIAEAGFFPREYGDGIKRLSLLKGCLFLNLVASKQLSKAGFSKIMKMMWVGIHRGGCGYGTNKHSSWFQKCHNVRNKS